MGAASRLGYYSARNEKLNLVQALLRERQLMTSYIPSANQTNPDGEAESGPECDGFFQHMITLPAPGAWF